MRCALGAASVHFVWKSRQVTKVNQKPSASVSKTKLAKVDAEVCIDTLDRATASVKSRTTFDGGAPDKRAALRLLANHRMSNGLFIEVSG